MIETVKIFPQEKLPELEEYFTNQIFNFAKLKSYSYSFFIHQFVSYVATKYNLSKVKYVFDPELRGNKILLGYAYEKFNTIHFNPCILTKPKTLQDLFNNLESIEHEFAHMFDYRKNAKTSKNKENAGHFEEIQLLENLLKAQYGIDKQKTHNLALADYYNSKSEQFATLISLKNLRGVIERLNNNKKTFWIHKLIKNKATINVLQSCLDEKIKNYNLGLQECKKYEKFWPDANEKLAEIIKYYSQDKGEFRNENPELVCKKLKPETRKLLNKNWDKLIFLINIPQLYNQSNFDNLFNRLINAPQTNHQLIFDLAKSSLNKNSQYALAETYKKSSDGGFDALQKCHHSFKSHARYQPDSISAKILDNFYDKHKTSCDNASIQELLELQKEKLNIAEKFKFSKLKIKTIAPRNSSPQCQRINNELVWI